MRKPLCWFVSGKIRPFYLVIGSDLAYILLFALLADYLQKNNIDLSNYEETEFDNSDPGIGIVFSRPGGLKENIEYFEMPDILKEKYQYFTEANINKLRGVGFDKKLTPIKEAVKDYVENYLNTSEPFLGE